MKSLILINEAPYRTSGAKNALRLAHALLKQQGAEVLVVLMADVVATALSGQKPPESHSNIMLKRILLCEWCMDARELQARLVLEGAAVSSMTGLAECITVADRALTFYAADMSGERDEHWTRVYTEKDPRSVSWFQPEPESSLRALDRFGAKPTSSFIDVGGGASNLVDALLGRGWRDVTVLDIAPSGLDRAKARLGDQADAVTWEVADVTTWHPVRHYDVWHDRAVFHFLVLPEQRAAYLQALAEGLAPGGLVIIAAFALDGPERCSGLPIERYDAVKLAAELGPSFELLDAWREEHVTPWGASQVFTWCVFRSSGME